MRNYHRGFAASPLRLLFLLIFSGFSVSGLAAQEFAVKGTLQWERLEIEAAVSLNLASAGLKLPGGRVQAEEHIIAAYPSLIQPFLLSLPVDSARTIADLLGGGELTLADLDQFTAEARVTAPAMTEDFTHLRSRYTIDLSKIGTVINKRSSATEILRPLTLKPSAEYTGIIIIANGELPLHGTRSTAFTLPCLFPKIWDTDMLLIFERNMLETGKTVMVRYAKEADILALTPSGLSEELKNLVGERPLRIFPQKVFGKRPTDPVIDREDALLITGNEANRRLLREGKVVIVLPDNVLSETYD